MGPLAARPHLSTARDRWALELGLGLLKRATKCVTRSQTHILMCSINTHAEVQKCTFIVDSFNAA